MKSLTANVDQTDESSQLSNHSESCAQTGRAPRTPLIATSFSPSGRRRAMEAIATD
ncbi:MAG: hypothetical protein FD188_3156 [Ignavibacteria bacterium]|nr:MAG: hypothetical protein FD188_3156 [Ignavibacteria bacterium]